MITIAVIDDTEKWISLTESHIKNMKNCSLIVKVYDGIEFVDWCYHHNQLPDIALVDIEMPKMDGVQLTDFLTDHFPNIKVIAISSHTHKGAVEDMIACGAFGFISKLYSMKNLPNAIIAVAEGKFYIDPILQLDDIKRENLLIQTAKTTSLNWSNSMPCSRAKCV